MAEQYQIAISQRADDDLDQILNYILHISLSYLFQVEVTTSPSSCLCTFFSLHLCTVFSVKHQNRLKKVKLK